MNNRVTITFSRNFVAGDNIGVYYSDPSTQTSGYWTFVWVSGTPGAFQVQLGSNTTDTAENFATAWSNSLSGFTVTQPVGGNDNQVQITTQTYHFVNVLAKFADGSTMAIPAHYNYVLSTVSTGNKITYEDKLPLNTPTADSKYLWKSVNANEVKTKHNLNDDRIGALETDMLGKADLVGGNDFTGNQTIDGDVGIGTENPTVKLDVRGNVKIGKDGVSPYLTFDENPDSGSGSEFYLTHDIDSNILKFTDDSSNDFIAMERQDGRVGIGTTSPSEKLEVKGRIYINPDGNVLPDGKPASMLVFRSKNTTGSTQAKSSIYALNLIDEKSGITFSTQQGSSTLNPRLEIRLEDGDVEVKQNLLVDKVIKINGTSRAYADLPSSPTVGMISYINDAYSVSYRGTAAGGGSDIALVFYDGSNWIYH